MKKILQPVIILILMTWLSPGTANAQDPLTFSQFFLNPYQFNPSYAAQQGKAEANLMLRQQWVGIENAPKAATFNIQAPFGRNVSLAFGANVSQTILVKSSALMGTFAYRVRIGYYHHLNFGLTLGASMNRFNLNAIADSGPDATLSNLVARNSDALSQFGINYQYKNLNIGFALPQLLDTRAVSVKEFQDVRFKPFSAKFASISYNMYVSRDIQLSPMVIYRALDNVQYQIEGMVTATFRNTVWVGASYRDGYGITGFIGFKMKNILRAGYAYERPMGNSLSSATSATHEFYAGTRFGKRDREAEYFAEKKTKDSLAQVAKTEEPAPREVVEKKKEEPKVEERKIEEPRVPETKAEETKPEEIKPEEKKVEEPVVSEPAIKETPAVTETTPPVTKPETTKPAVNQAKKAVYTGYYVIVGAFKKYGNAMKEINTLRDMSLFPEMIYMLDKDFYYIYLYHSEDRKTALKELNRARTKIPKAWLLQPNPEGEGQSEPK
jgi:type IX secretion system PorP/SprF family membrane protein